MDTEMATKVEAKVIRTSEEELYCDLSPDEVRERGEALASELEVIRQTEEDAKDSAKAYKQTIKLCKERAAKLGAATRFHRELRLVEVEVRDAGQGMVNIVRRDTGEIARSRKMTDEERQMTVPRIDQVEPAAAAEGKKRRVAKA